jgi:hypothetical protein
MKWIVTLIVVGSIVTGCSTMRTAHVDEGGFASPPSDQQLDPVRKTSDSDEHPGKTWSVREFAQPRGLYQ